MELNTLFANVTSPAELMQYLDDHLQYGVVTADGKVLTDADPNFQAACSTDWRLRTAADIVQTGVGHCYDQVEVERAWFQAHQYPVKTYWISAFQENVPNSGYSHSFLVYQDQQTNQWHVFEHAHGCYRGIEAFPTLEAALADKRQKQIAYATTQRAPADHYATFMTEFPQPRVGMNMGEYLNFVSTAREVQPERQPQPQSPENSLAELITRAKAVYEHLDAYSETDLATILAVCDRVHTAAQTRLAELRTPPAERER